jgi:membrane protease YdiL (CAAX protease family)
MKRSGTFLLLLVVGLLVYSVGGYLASIPQGARTVVKTTLPLLLLLAVWACGRVERFRPWRPTALAFFAASCGFLLAWVLSPHLLGLFGITPDRLPGIALTKLSESVLVAAGVLVAAHAGGMRRADLYLGFGRVRVWAPIGGAAFAVFLVIFLLLATNQGRSPGELAAAAPWILVFIFANAFMEELHFRGLLLQPFEGRLGRGAANLCVTVLFTLVHAPVQYAPDLAIFLTVLFVLAWLWGALIQRTEALWGAVLFHAGADLLVIQGIVATSGGG